MNGPQEPGVDEPFGADKFDLGIAEPVLSMEFTEYIEPKGLAVDELTDLASQFGSYAKAARLIGTSEAFVRYRVEGRKRPCEW